MGFKDFFKPKWKHSKASVRRIAIEDGYVTDQAILADIAKNDKDGWVRAAAVEKLTDQKVLIEIAKSDDIIIRDAAVYNSNITDQDFLMDIAKNHTNCELRLNVAGRLNDKFFAERIYIDIAMNYPQVDYKLKALEHISDQSVLTEIAKNGHINNKLRMFAALKMKDKSDVQRVFYDYAKDNQYNWQGRKKAIENLIHQNLLEDIVKTEKDIDVREAAMDQLKRLKSLSNESSQNTIGKIDIPIKYRGGAGEPYCSKECYDLAGKEIGLLILSGVRGICWECQKYVVKNCVAVTFEMIFERESKLSIVETIGGGGIHGTSRPGGLHSAVYHFRTTPDERQIGDLFPDLNIAVMFPYENRIIFWCKKCMPWHGKNFVENIKSCCKCGKELISI